MCNQTQSAHWVRLTCVKANMIVVGSSSRMLDTFRVKDVHHYCVWPTSTENLEKGPFRLRGKKAMVA